jgi:hypothetical protein
MNRLIRRRWHGINWRCGNQKSYLRKNITNEFKDYEEFRTHAINCGIQLGYQTHRNCKNSGYSIENVTFVSPEVHLRLSSLEKRKLLPTDVLIVRSMHASGNSTHKIARQFKVSQTAIWRCVNYVSYRDVVDPETN